MKKVLVTGADGFIGSQVVALLGERGYEVHAVIVGDQPAGHLEKGLQYHRCNLLDDRQVRKLLAAVKPSQLLHLAWYTEHKKYWESPLNVRWVQASLTLYAAFAQNGGKRAVTAGTCAEYDWSYGYCSEEITPCRPSTLYGISKHCLHEMFKRLAPQLGISSSWGRIFFLYGPREHPGRLIPSIIRSLLRGRPAHCANGEQTKDFLYVEDAAGALVELLGSKVEGAVNIASGTPVKLQDVVLMLGGKMGRPDLIASDGAGRPGVSPLFLLADITRLREEVGWEPRFDLSSGLDRTIQWWRER
ncbi:MAG: NAD(P)-dependent oxidoreductase [PVC group bacterium]